MKKAYLPCHKKKKGKGKFSAHKEVGRGGVSGCGGGREMTLDPVRKKGKKGEEGGGPREVHPKGRKKKGRANTIKRKKKGRRREQLGV